jgi:hypothetical protein
LLNAFPEGRLSEIVGPRSSGGGSLLLALLARAASRGGLVALVDGADAFDPETAARAGLDLRALLWVRCGGRLQPAWSAVDLLARCPGFAVVALDLGTAWGTAGGTGPVAAPPSFGVRLQRAAAGNAAVVVVRAPRHVTGSAAALVVSVRRVRARWIGAPRRIRLGGLVSEARVLRSRFDPRLAASGRAWLIEWRV